MSKDINKKKSIKKSSICRRSSRSKDYSAAKPRSSFADDVRHLDSKFEKLDLLDNRRHHQTLKSNQPDSETKSVKPYKLKIVKFQTTETIEGLGSLNKVDRQNQPDFNIKVVRKSRHSPESGLRIKIIDDGETPMNKLTLGAIFNSWANVANFASSVEAGDTKIDRKCCEPTKQRKSIPGGDKISSSCESNTKRIRKRSSFGKKPLAVATSSSTLIKHIYHPSYKDTVASKMRYEFKRNKKVCPYYIIQHVMKYQRPPFWNYTKMGKGFNGVLTREQLKKICDI